MDKDAHAHAATNKHDIHAAIKHLVDHFIDDLHVCDPDAHAQLKRVLDDNFNIITSSAERIYNALSLRSKYHKALGDLNQVERVLYKQALIKASHATD